MRILVVLQGVPGSGKTKFIKENSLEDYTLCPDNIRLMFSAPTLVNSKEGGLEINGRNDEEVWELFFKLLEKRMNEGHFTVIDATNLSNKTLGRYKTLCVKYGYRILIGTIPAREEAWKGNLNRIDYRRLPRFVWNRFDRRIRDVLKEPYITPSQVMRILEKPIRVCNPLRDIIFLGSGSKKYYNEVIDLFPDALFVFVDGGDKNKGVVIKEGDCYLITVKLGGENKRLLATKHGTLGGIDITKFYTITWTQPIKISDDISKRFIENQGEDCIQIFSGQGSTNKRSINLGKTRFLKYNHKCQELQLFEKLKEVKLYEPEE